MEPAREASRAGEARCGEGGEGGEPGGSHPAAPGQALRPGPSWASPPGGSRWKPGHGELERGSHSSKGTVPGRELSCDHECQQSGARGAQATEAERNRADDLAQGLLRFAERLRPSVGSDRPRTHINVSQGRDYISELLPSHQATGGNPAQRPRPHSPSASLPFPSFPLPTKLLWAL